MRSAPRGDGSPTPEPSGRGRFPRSRSREEQLLEAVETIAALVDTLDEAILAGARLTAAATLLASGRVRSSIEAAEMVRIMEYDLEAMVERVTGAAGEVEGGVLDGSHGEPPE